MNNTNVESIQLRRQQMSSHSIASRVKRRQRHDSHPNDTQITASDPKKTTKKCGKRHVKPKTSDERTNDDIHVFGHSLDALNDDCLRHIFGRLSLVDRFRCLRVCERWHRLIVSVLRTQTSMGMKNITYDRSDCSLNASHSVVNEDLIDWAVFEWPTGDDSQEAGDDLRNAVQRNHIQCVRNLRSVFSKCPKLLSLDLRSIHLTDSLVQLIADYCPQLECLNLNSMVITDTVWQSLSRRLGHRLIHLVIRNSIEKNQTPIVEKFIRSCDRLKCLKVTEWEPNLELKWFDCISQTVEEIHISCTSAKCLFTSIDPKNVSNIKRLKLKTFDSLSQLVIDSIGTHFVNLTQFLSTNVEGIPKRSYRPIAGLAQLNHLAMDLPFTHLDEDFAHLAIHCTQMRSIELNFGCFSLNSLQTICRHWPQLESISFDLVSVEKLNSDALHVLMDWKHLKRLSLYGTNINDDICHVIHSLHSLRYLNLDLCNNVSKRVIHSFINRAKHKPKELFELSLKETRITSLKSFKNVNIMAEGIAKLNNLYVYYTPRET